MPTSSPATLRSKLRDLHPSVHGVQHINTQDYSTKYAPFACTECFGPRNIEECSVVKETVKCNYSNNLKNDYENVEINMNSQESKHEDKKSDEH